MPGLSFEEWIRQLQDLEDVKDGFSSRDIANKTNKSISWSSELITRLVTRGICEYVGKKCIRGVMGQLHWTPIYRFKNTSDETEEAKKSKKKVRKRRL